MTQQDWDLILSNAKYETFPKDVPIISEGDTFQRIFQLSKGACRVETTDASKNKRVLAKIRHGEDSQPIFGEISFLENKPASASVISDMEDTGVYILEGYLFDVLAEHYPGLSGRFYHYLAQMLSKRLKQREEVGLELTFSTRSSSRRKKHSRDPSLSLRDSKFEENGGCQE
eukprot:TRINITY_DN2179_c0_g1_i1.p1 TRINITY_DN2179_c0_g1~~TRINITY_DN2179_c0_g1_i1.p1  ORF type:complete len:189 (-),score=35.46 TRINITY_DN2179_c0_g1_i1:51-566(-)